MTEAERDAVDAEAAALTASFGHGVDALRMLVRQRQAQRQVRTRVAVNSSNSFSTHIPSTSIMKHFNVQNSTYAYVCVYVL